MVGEDGMPYVWLYESEQMFGLRLTPRFAVQIHSIEACTNGTMHETSISKLKEAGELDWDAFRENTATLPPCSPPPLPPPAPRRCRRSFRTTMGVERGRRRGS